MMKIDILYSTNSEATKELAIQMSRWVKGNVVPISEYKKGKPSDLLVVAFKDSFFKDKELNEFIDGLDRSIVKNLCLVTPYYLNENKLKKVISFCQKHDLPLMREHYSFKMTFKERMGLNQSNIDGARLYIEDMVNLVRNYY